MRRGSGDYYTWRSQLQISLDGVNPTMCDAPAGVARASWRASATVSIASLWVLTSDCICKHSKTSYL